MFASAELATILGSLPDPAFVITRSGLYAAVFGGRDTRYYHDGTAIIGKRVEEFMDDDHVRWILDNVAIALERTGLHVIEYDLAYTDLDYLSGLGPAEVLRFEARIQRLPFQVGNEDAVLWVASNITDRYRLERELRHLSETDALTGLWNRRHFSTRSAEALSEARRLGCPMSIAVADLDHFKKINDGYGHQTGDLVLTEVAARLRTFLRKGDMAARWGGEEFVILLQGLALPQAAVLVEQIRLAVANLPMSGGAPVTMSLGVSSLSAADDDLSSLIARADAALYRAKSAGRNRTCLAEPPVSPQPPRPAERQDGQQAEDRRLAAL